MRYLLDTNIVSDLMRHPRGKASRRVAQLDDHLLCTSIIVVAELRFGIEKNGSAELARKLALMLDVLDVAPFAAPADEHYARLRTALERRGTPVGGNDLLIAAQALALNCVMVTGNVKEFERVPGLTVENWPR